MHPPSPSLTTSPSHPPAKPGELPLLCSPSSTFHLPNRLVLLYLLLPFASPLPTPYVPDTAALPPTPLLTPRAHSSPDDLSKIGNPTIVDRRPSSPSSLDSRQSRANFVSNSGRKKRSATEETRFRFRRNARVPGRKFLSGWISSRFEIETFPTLEKRGTLNRCESGGSRHLRLFPRLLTRIKFKRGFN